MFEQYFPAILTFIGVIISVVINLWLDMSKQKVSLKEVDISAESEFRDDLLTRNESLVKQLDYRDQQITSRDSIIDKKNDRIDLLQQALAQQAEKALDLTLTLKQANFDKLDCENKVIELQALIDQIQRKVYYVRELVKEEQTTGDKHE